MAGDSANARLWTGADVYVAPVGSVGPTDANTALDAAFDAVGLLDGEEGFVEARADETEDYFAWGGILVKTTRSKHKRTIKFVALEDNDTVFALANPGSTRPAPVAGLTTATVKVPDRLETALVFEVADGDVVKRRYVKRAEVFVSGETKESESGLTVYQFTAILYPESDGTLYKEFTEAA